jgi:hypothetical protein
MEKSAASKGVGWSNIVAGPEVAIGFYDGRESPGRRYRHNVAWRSSRHFSTIAFNENKWDELDKLEELVNDHLRLADTMEEIADE